MSKYVPGDLLNEADLAIKAGVPIGDIAQRLGLEVSDLQQRLGLPVSQQAQQANSGDDFACVRLRSTGRAVMTADQIINAKQMIGCGWKVAAVARHYKLTERELRVELGMPVFETTSERVALPWEKRQRDLFDQPTREGVSER